MNLSPLARKILSGVTPYTSGKPIEEVERQTGLPNAIKLASNENPLGPSPKALEAIRQALPNIHRYPDSHCVHLVNKLAERLGLSSDQIIVGNGSDELITLTARAFLEPGDEVVVADPTFLIYRIASQIAGANVRVVASHRFRYDLSRMRRAISHRTKIVFIANPDNPTGTYSTRAELEAFLGNCPEGVLVFLDEAYAQLVEAPDYPDGREQISRGNVFVSRTFSKAYGLSGIRVGFGMACPPIIAALQRVREPFNVNSLAQAAAAAALEDEEHLASTRRLLRQEKPAIFSALKELGCEAIPSATNFILFHVGKEAPRVVEELLKRGIIVRGMSAWNLTEYIRVTVGLPQENQAFINALRETLTPLRRIG